MTWIALKMLTGDKPKFLGIVLGLTFAALLITQQGSIFCGLMCRTAGQVYDITGADLWVMDPNVRFVDDIKPMIENNLYRVRGVDGIEWAVPLYKGNARAKLNSTGIDPVTKQPRSFQVIEQVILLGLDDNSMIGAPPPGRMLAGSLEDLRQPEAVMVDFTRLRKLYPGEPWDQEPALPGLIQTAREGIGHLLHEAGLIREDPAEVGERERARARSAFYSRFLGRDLEMNDHRGHIVAVCEATRTFQSNAVVYTTYSRAKLFVPRERKILSYVLARVAGADRPGLTDEQREGIRQEAARRIAGQTGLRARTSRQFIWDTIDYYMKYTGIPINFGITAVLGFIVGTAIAGQTFYNFTLDNLKQFGALKAMGASNLRIVGMILLQATVTGLLGYGIGVGLAALFGQASRGGELAFFTPWQLLPISGVAVVAICLLASLVCVRRVIVLEPAVVFRG
ncbi:ABC transporter permease [Tundrisphaera sp. TA3]|uniref:ABC transporter permease n=1 Tax=Tundrisphaera sp. TA3 TaxID=3435775 RepID=UPI003EBA4094